MQYCDNTVLFCKILEALKRAVVCVGCKSHSLKAVYLLGGCVLGDSLGTFADSVLGKLTGQQKSDCGLDLPRCDGRSFVVVSKSAGLGADSLEDIVDERVHDRHGL